MSQDSLTPPTPVVPTENPVKFIWWNIYGSLAIILGIFYIIMQFKHFVDYKITTQTFLLSTSSALLNVILGYLTVRCKSRWAFIGNSINSTLILLIINLFYLKKRWTILSISHPEKFIWWKTGAVTAIFYGIIITKILLPPPIENKYLSFTPPKNWTELKKAPGETAQFGTPTGEKVIISTYPDYLDPLEGTTKLLNALKSIDPKISITTMDNEGHQEWTVLETAHKYKGDTVYQRILLHFGRKGATEICVMNLDQKSSTTKTVADYLLNNLRIAN